MQQHFQANLSLLCSYLPSVSEVCRRIEINRAQFNKYISGTVHPNRHNLRKICDFFGVEEYELLLPRAQFKKMVALRPNNLAKIPTREDRLMEAIRMLQAASDQQAMRDYAGYYHEYYYSMSQPGKILRTLVYIDHHDGITFSTRIEKLEPVGSRAGGPRCRYQGQVLFLADRIYVVDYETLTSSEMSQTILLPNYKSLISHLNGLKLGIDATQRRAPTAVRVTWEFLGKRPRRFQLLRNIGFLDPDDPALSKDLLSRIDNEQQDHTLFSAWSGIS